jgi:hypothetical protein
MLLPESVGVNGICMVPSHSVMSSLGVRVACLHRYRDERLIRCAHPRLKSWAGARDSQANRKTLIEVVDQFPKLTPLLAIWAGTNNIPKLAPEACNLVESTITIGVALGR